MMDISSLQQKLHSTVFIKNFANKAQWASKVAMEIYDCIYFTENEILYKSFANFVHVLRPAFSSGVTWNL